MIDEDRRGLIAVATVPTVYGIETDLDWPEMFGVNVATVPTVYGIETQLWIV